MQKTKKKIVALLMGIGACALTFATLAAAGVFGSDAAPIEQAEQVQLSDATNLRLETTDRSPGRFTLRATLTGKRPEGEGQAVQFYSGTQAVGAPVAMDASGVATITLKGTQTDAHEFGAELLGAEDAPSKVAGYVRVDGSVQWQSLPFSGTDGDPYELTSGHYYIADSVSEFDAGKPGYIIKGTSDVTFDLNGKLFYTSEDHIQGSGSWGYGMNPYFQVGDNAVFTLLDSAPKDEEHEIYDQGVNGFAGGVGGHWLSWEDTKDLETSQENPQYRHTMKGGMIIGRVVSNMGAVIHATGSATVTVRDVQLYGHCAANQYIYDSQKSIGCGVIYAQDNVTCMLENVDIGYIYIFGAMSPPNQRISGVAIHAAGSARIDVKDCIIGDVYFRDAYYLNRFNGLGGAICAEQNGTIVIDGLRMEGNLFEIASFGYAIVGSGSGATIEIRNCHLKEKATIGMSFKETSTKANIVVSEGFFQYDVAQSVKNGNFTLESTSYLDDITQDPGYQGSEEVKAGYTDAVLTGAYQVQPGTPVYDGKSLEQGTDFTFVNARFNLTPTYQYRSVSDSALQQGLPVNAGEYEIVLSYQEASSNYFWIPAGEETFLIEIGQYDIANATVSVTGTYEYNGTEHRPQFANLSQSGPVQFTAKDIQIRSYSNNVNAGTAQVVIEGIGNFTGTKTLSFTIGQRKLSNVKFQTSVSYTYDGTAKTPQLSELTYSDGTIPITSDDFYIKDYTNNTDAGLATINLEAKRNYTGSATIRFRINAKPVTAEWLLNGSAWQSSIDYTAGGHLVKVSVPGLLAQDSISIELSVAEIDQNPVGTRVSATEYRLTDAFDVPYQLEVKLDGSKKSNYQLSGATNTLFIGNGVLGLKVEFFAKDGKTPLENRYSLDTNNHITINLKISDASGKAFTSDVVLTVKVASTTVQLTNQNGAFVGTADMGELTGSSGKSYAVTITGTASNHVVETVSMMYEVNYAKSLDTWFTMQNVTFEENKHYWTNDSNGVTFKPNKGYKVSDTRGKYPSSYSGWVDSFVGYDATGLIVYFLEESTGFVGYDIYYTHRDIKVPEVTLHDDDGTDLLDASGETGKKFFLYTGSLDVFAQFSDPGNENTSSGIKSREYAFGDASGAKTSYMSLPSTGTFTLNNGYTVCYIRVTDRVGNVTVATASYKQFTPLADADGNYTKLTAAGAQIDLGNTTLLSVKNGGSALSSGDYTGTTIITLNGSYLDALDMHAQNTAKFVFTVEYLPNGLTAWSQVKNQNVEHSFDYTLTVTKANFDRSFVTVTVDGHGTSKNDFMYDGTPFPATVQMSSKFDGDYSVGYAQVNVSKAYARYVLPSSVDVVLPGEDAPVEAGSWSVTVRITNSNLYKDATVDSLYTFKIEPRRITVQYHAASSVYGDPIADLTSTVTVGSVVGSDVAYYAYTTAHEYSSVGEYEIVAVDPSSNYEVTFLPLPKYKILPATLTDATVGVTAEYDGQKHSIVLAPGAFKNGDDIGDFTVEFSKNGSSWSSSPIEAVGVADSTRVYYRLVNKNYNTLTGDVELTITPRDLANASISVNGTYTYQGSAHTLTPADFSLSDGSIAIAQSDISIDGYADNTDAGTAHVTLRGTGNYQGTVTVDFTIEKAQLSAADFNFTAPADTTYSAAEKSADVAFIKQLVGAGAVTVLYSSDAATFKQVQPLNTGVYYIFIDVAEGSNYHGLSQLALGKSFTITPKTVSLTWLLDGGAWKDSADYKAGGYVISVNTSDILDGGVMVLLHAKSTQVDQKGATVTLEKSGSYTITAELSGNTLGNYVLDSATEQKAFSLALVQLTSKLQLSDSNGDLLGADVIFTVDSTGKMFITAKLMSADGSALPNGLTVTLTVRFSVGGASNQYPLQFDGSAYTERFEIPFAKGTYRVTVTATDPAGNYGVTTPSMSSFDVDWLDASDAWESNGYFDGSVYWDKNAVRFTAKSGYEVGTALTSFGKDVTATKDDAAFRFYYKNAKGQVGFVEKSVKMDSAAPTADIGDGSTADLYNDTKPAGEEFWVYAGTLSVEISGSDGGSGVREIMYKFVKGTSDTGWAQLKGSTLALDPDYDILYVKVTDNVGNEAQFSATFRNYTKLSDVSADYVKLSNNGASMPQTFGENTFVSVTGNAIASGDYAASDTLTLTSSYLDELDFTGDRKDYAFVVTYLPGGLDGSKIKNPAAPYTFTFTVKTEKATIGADSFSFSVKDHSGSMKYDASEYHAELTHTAGLGAVTYYYNGSTSAPVNAGTYRVTADIPETKYYKQASGLGDAKWQFTIEKATGLQASAADIDVIYDGAKHPVDVVVTGFVGGEDQHADGYLVEYSTDKHVWLRDHAPVNVADSGVVYFRVSYTNYQTVEGMATVTIAARSFETDGIQLVVKGDYTYTGKPLNAQFEVLGSATIRPEDYSVSYSNNVNAGTATVVITGTGNYTGTLSTQFTIDKAALNGLKAEIEGWRAGEKASAPTLTGNVSGGDVTYRYTGKTADGAAYDSTEAPKTAGEYRVIVTVGETMNYLGGSAFADFTIGAPLQGPSPWIILPIILGIIDLILLATAIGLWIRRRDEEREENAYAASDASYKN